MPLAPFTIVSTTSTTYATLLLTSQYLSLPTSDISANLKAVSSLHACVTTALGLYALARPWPVPHATPPLNLGLGTSSFDDSANPLIAGHSALGNAVTAIETGYLLFDTLALIYMSSRQSGRDIGKAVGVLAKRDPLTLFHHLSLLAGLGILQHFLSRGRERGVYIIVALILMNASTPLLHLRWYRRKVTGKGSLVPDVALAVAFAVARLGSVWWVVRRYGEVHGGVGVWEALRAQRWVCQVGTAGLVGLNGVWLGMLCKSIVQRTMGKGRQRSGR